MPFVRLADAIHSAPEWRVINSSSQRKATLMGETPFEGIKMPPASPAERTPVTDGGSAHDHLTL